MAYSHRDGYLTITPTAGPNKGKPKRVKAGEKVAFDPGGKTTYMKQFEQTPLAIIRGAADPKLDIDLSDGSEAWALSQYVGGIGGYDFTVSFVLRRPGQLFAAAWSFENCQLESGGGFDSDDGKGVASKLALKLLDAKLNGVSIYNRRYAV